MNRRELILKELSENPTDPLNYYLFAVEERSIGDFDASIEQLVYLINQHPNYHPSYYMLAEIYYHLDRIEEGTQIALQGIQKAKNLQLLKVSSELEQLINLND